MGDFDPFVFFKSESSHADVEVRAAALRRVIQIVCLMNTDLVVSEMLPYLQSTYCKI